VEQAMFGGGTKSNETYQLMMYADDMNLLGGNKDTVKENTETLTDPSKKVGLEVNAEKTIYMLHYHHQNSGKNYDIKITKISSENVSQFKYLEMIDRPYIPHPIIWNSRVVRENNLVMSPTGPEIKHCCAGDS
jgi:hypothetical protein